MEEDEGHVGKIVWGRGRQKTIEISQLHGTDSHKET